MIKARQGPCSSHRGPLQDLLIFFERSPNFITTLAHYDAAFMLWAKEASFSGKKGAQFP